MTITPSMVLEAIKTGHEGCAKGCVHAEAIAANIDSIVTVAAVGVAETGISPTVALISEAFHVGFRTAQLVAQAETKNTVPAEKGN